MPQRVSSQAIGTHVGRVIFGPQATSSLIARKLDALPTGKIKAVMDRRGLRDISLKKMSDVLSGKDKAGMRHADIKRMVEVLQEVGIAKQGMAASRIVMTAAAEIQKGHGLGSMDRGGRFLKEPQTNKEESSSRQSILDRMRGVVGQMQRANREEAEESLNPEQKGVSTPSSDGGIRGLRESMREVLTLPSMKRTPRP